MNDQCTRRTFLRRGTNTLLAAGVAPAVSAYAKPQAESNLVWPSPLREYRRGGMRYRRLGRTDLFVSALSFGSHTNPTFKQKAKHGHILSPEGQAQRDRHIARALDLGVNMVDTYENMGQWEPMARLARPKRDKVLVSLCRQFPMFVGENIERACKLFGYVDLYRIFVGDGNGVTDRNLEDWDVMRKAKAAGKLRAIGISTHSERMMLSALDELEGLDYVMFPYNFIHARADYSVFLPKAIHKGVGLIAIKPLAAGSIVRLDPRAPAGSRPENERTQFYRGKIKSLHPEVVAKLTETLTRVPDESLCQAALRFVYRKRFISAAMAGMFQEREVLDNHAALQRHLEQTAGERSVLKSAERLANLRGPGWLPHHYRWLDERWRG